jgi:hypothetical protein
MTEERFGFNPSYCTGGAMQVFYTSPIDRTRRSYDQVRDLTIEESRIMLHSISIHNKVAVVRTPTMQAVGAALGDPLLSL